jgi:uncharacterized protein YhaN
MKLIEIGLNAYGPFTDVKLDFSEGKEGLHIVYGPNETGKTSALRAIRALLHGIEERTADNFVHDNKKLRVGGRIRRSNGTDLTFQRRKGRKNTLLDESGNAIDEAELKKILGGVSRELFETAFAISHADLVAGGKELLRGGGDVGESLFAAGMGVSGLGDVLEALETESGELFKPGGQKPAINAALSRHKKEKGKIKDHTLLSRDWKKIREELEQLGQEREAVEKELDERRREKMRLERLKKALPRIARRAEFIERLDALGEVPLLREKFFEERVRTTEAFERAFSARDRAAAEIERLKEEIKTLKVPEGILGRDETIADLHERLGIQRKATRDSAKLRVEHRQLDEEARALLQELRPGLELEVAAAERLKPAERVRIRELADSFGALHEGLARTVQEVVDLGDSLDEARETLAKADEPRDPSELALRLGRVHKRGDEEAELAEVEQDIEARADHAQVDLERLGLWQKPLAEVEAIPVPTDETVERCTRDIEEVESRRSAIYDRAAEARGEIGQLDSQLAELRLAGAVPTEEDLGKARQHRDEGWMLVRRIYIEGVQDDGAANAYALDLPLPDAYERSVAAADDIGDRLRRESERVARQAQLMARKEELAGRLEEIAEEEKSLDERHSAAEADWKKVWEGAGIDPLPPREMSALLRQHRKLVTELQHLRELRQRAAALGKSIEAHRADLAEALEGLGKSGPADGEPLDALLDRCQAAVEAIKESARTRTDLEKKVRELEKSLKRATRKKKEQSRALESWRKEWSAAVAPLGLADDASTGQANAVLERFETFFKRVDKASDHRRRLDSMDRDARQFEEDLRAVLDELDEVKPDLLGLKAQQAAEALNKLFVQAQGDESRRQELEKQLQEKKEALAEAQRDIVRLQGQLDGLCREAGVGDVNELPAVEERSREAREVRREVEDLQRLLVEDGGGASLEEILAEAQDVDRDAIPGQLEGLQHEMEELEARRSDKVESIGRNKHEFDAMDGSAEAAEAAEHAESIVSEIRDYAERYARLRLAQVILRREIERYRADNQAPLLSRAGELFCTMTLESFVELVPDYDLHDEPVLVGVRPSGDRVEVEGMSDGTRDQLYLALRLAALEQYVESNEPLPLIVDDILIRYDDERATAALRALADLSRKTQVIFFTHHQRLVEVAEGMGDKEAVLVHRLLASHRNPVVETEAG